MKRRILWMGAVPIVAVLAVAVMLPLQAALADKPDPVKAVVTFVQASWENGKLTVTQGIPAGEVKTVECPEGSATSVQFTAAGGQDGEDAPIEVQCFEFDPANITTVPDGEGNFSVVTEPFEGGPSLNCEDASTFELSEVKPEDMEKVMVIRAPEVGAQVLEPAQVAGQAVVINCGGLTEAGE